MKIGFEDTPAAPAGTYSRHLAELLAEYAPEHEYIVDGARYKEFDLYHGFRPGLPLPLLRKIPSVMTVHNLNFLRYPHLYSLPERLVLLRLYRRALRSASLLITVNRDARAELSERLRIDPGRIEVVMPLAARVPHETPGGAQLEAVRRKYMLPGRFILMLGTVEPRHNHEVLFEAVGSLGERERAIRAEGLRAAQRAAAAASAEGGKVVGVDVDQSSESETVVTSAMKGLSDAAEWAIAKVYDGTWDEIGNAATSLGVAENAVGLPTATWSMENFSVADYEDLFQKVLNGDITIDNNSEMADPSTAGLSNVNVNYIGG